MRTTAAIASACAFAALLAFAPPAAAGKNHNGPALDGQRVALPDRLAGTSEAGFFGGGPGCPQWSCGSNGPALDGQKVVLPDWAGAEQEISLPAAPDSGDLAKLTGNDPSFDGQQLALPGGPVHARR